MGVGILLQLELVAVVKRVHDIQFQEQREVDV